MALLDLQTYDTPTPPPKAVGGSVLSLNEMVELGASDPEFFYRSFFPKTVRQPSPKMHLEIDLALDNPKYRLCNFVLPRDFAKTTKLRLFTARRIAYNVSRTVLYVGASESHAARSIRWIRNQIEKNKLFAQTFDLRPGGKWTDTELEIIHGVDEQPIWILGNGITGNIRGINFDDYRPDLIVLDDILTDENAATLEQREKVSDLVLGALKDSLAPRSEEPNAKLVMLNTPQHIDDVSMVARKDPQFYSVVYSCWTPETADLEPQYQRSAWEERHPTEDLRAEKSFAIQRNRLSIFTREKECRLVSRESCSFKSEWLNFYDEKPEGCFAVVAIDPVPPPSERQMEKKLKGKDYEAIVVWGRKGGQYYLLDYATAQGNDPGWTLSKMLEFALRYKAVRIKIESIAYQRILKNLLEVEMARRRTYFPIVPTSGDKRSKFTRIVSTFSGPASAGLINIGREHTGFAEQFLNYGPTFTDHDDIIDASSIALDDLVSPYLELGSDDYEDTSGVPAVKVRRGAP